MIIGLVGVLMIIAGTIELLEQRKESTQVR